MRIASLNMALGIVTVSSLLSLPVLAQFKTGSDIPSKKQLSLTPAMGWNSWNTFGCNVSDSLIREMADAMVASGMKDAGYEYVNIDDCWHGGRDESGNIQADPKKFPHGIKALADYVHGKGLKIGIYSDAGNKTCAGYPGSRGYEYQDALQYQAWGIDYLKYDWCNTENLNPIGAYTTMGEALAQLDRPILFSLCEWGDNQPWEWGKDVGHSWRTTGDIYNCWDCEHSHGSWASLGVLPILDKQMKLRKYAGPSHWNDMDMMEVGNGMTTAQDRSHFTLWAVLNSPLIAGNDLRSMSNMTRDILTNRDIIALNQDKLGIQAMRMLATEQLNLFTKPLENGDWAFVFLNRSATTLVLDYDWNYYLLKDDEFGKRIDFNQEKFTWRDLWTGNKGDTLTSLNVSIPPHDVVVLRLTPKT